MLDSIPQKPSSSERGNTLLRKLDALGGVPLVAGLGVFRRPRALPDDASSVGLFMFGAIGDSILASAIIGDLRRKFPAAKIVGFLSEANRGVADILVGLDETVFVSIKNPLKAVKILRRRPVDILVDFGQWARLNAVLSACAKTRYAVGFRTAGQFRHFCYDAASEHRGDRHELENFRGLARLLGIEPVGMPRINQRVINEPLPFNPRPPYIAFHPWASGYRGHMREWPAERWGELGRELVKSGYSVIITGSASDRERSLALARTIGDPRMVVVAAGASGLAQTAAILHNAAVVVSVNTGVMHIAAALDCRLVSLHGPTDPLRWGPLGSRSTVLSVDKTDGGAYLNLGFEYPSSPSDCMSKITVNDVKRAVEDKLKSRGT